MQSITKHSSIRGLSTSTRATNSSITRVTNTNQTKVTNVSTFRTKSTYATSYKQVFPKLHTKSSISSVNICPKKYIPKSMAISSNLDSISSHPDVMEAKIQFSNSVRNMGTFNLRSKTKGTLFAEMTSMYMKAARYHTIAESVKAANPLHTIYSKNAEALNIPTITSLSEGMQALSDSVASGEFFRLTTDQQLELFKPLSATNVLNMSGISPDNAEAIKLFDQVFTEHYRLAAASRNIDVLANIHKAVNAFSAYKDNVDSEQVEKPKSKRFSNSNNSENNNNNNEQDNNTPKEDKDGNETKTPKEDKDGNETKTTTKKSSTTPPIDDGLPKINVIDKDNPNLRQLNDKWDNLLNNLDKRTQEHFKGKDDKGRANQDKEETNDENKEDRDPKEIINEVPEWAKKAIAITFIVLSLLLMSSTSEKFLRAQHTYQQFVDELLIPGHVVFIEVNGTTATAQLKTKVAPYGRTYAFDFVSFGSFEQTLREDIRKHNIPDVPLLVNRNAESIGTFLASLVPTLLLLGGTVYLFRRLGKGTGNLMRDPFGNSKKFTIVKNVKTRFKDVAGMDEAKQEIIEFVDFLKNPQRYAKLGANLPKGALLSGPPGTGKTLLARATAGEAGVAFYPVSGSEFLEMYVGVGASRVRELFKAARKNAPSIIFIDEIDAVARGRSKKGGFGGNDERENTLNQMLVEMDGFTSNEAVVVFAATNRADMLDSALLRPGRFDRKIQVNAPDIQGRADIFKVHLTNIVTSVDKNEAAAKLAALTPGMVGADIANVCNEAAIIAARTNKDFVEMVDFEKAVDRILAGIEKHSRILTPEERRTVAYHEAGHAVLGWVLEHADPLLKVTIVPRSNGALGFAQYLPKETALFTTDALCDMICMALGGRAAEQLFFNKITTGASDDIRKTSSIARGMVTRYGMTDSLYNMCFETSETEQQFYAPYSESTSQLIDEESKRIVSLQYTRALDLLNANKDKVKALAEALLEKETINHDGLVEILGPRLVQTDSYIKYLEAQKTAVRELNELEKKAQEEAVEAERAAQKKRLQDELDSTNTNAKNN